MNYPNFFQDGTVECRLSFQFAYWYEIFQSQGDSIENIGQKIIISRDDNCRKKYLDLPLVLSSGGFVLHQCMKSHLIKVLGRVEI